MKVKCKKNPLAAKTLKEEVRRCGIKFYKGGKKAMPLAGGVFVVAAVIGAVSWWFRR